MKNLDELPLSYGTMSALSQQLRHANWKLKLMAKQCGKQGTTIYSLRCQLVELQTMMTKEARGDYRRLIKTNETLIGENAALAEENMRLRERLDQLVEQPEPVRS